MKAGTIYIAEKPSLPREVNARALSPRAMKGPWHASRVDSNIYIYICVVFHACY